MSFADRWLLKPSVNTSEQDFLQPNLLHLQFDKDVPELIHKSYDKIFNYHLCVESQVNQLLKNYEYSKRFEKAEKEFDDMKKSMNLTVDQLVVCKATMSECNDDILKELHATLDIAQEWMKSKVPNYTPTYTSPNNNKLK
ncbi:hypothetical protein ABK040_011581 [Willaertia magna]